MPGKINPGICEAVNMVCIQITGYDLAVGQACSAGQLELNTHMPLVGYNVIHALQMLQRACRTFIDKCMSGITANTSVCAAHFENSAGLATVLNPKLGYDRVAELVKESLSTGLSLKDLVLEKEIMTPTEWDQLISCAYEPNL
jgi:aspartate ammonia-lyase